MAGVGSSLQRLLLLAMLALLPIGAGAPIAQAATTPVARGGPDAAAPGWEDCGPAHPGYECATVPVPLDHDRPSGPSTRLALARWPATDARHRIGTVFINPGGPGGSGVEYLLDGFGENLGTQLGGRFDVVGFDPRGVGASTPLHCFDSEDDLVAFWESQPIFPYRAEQYRPFFEAFTGFGATCRAAGGRITAHMNTADVARDLDHLRRAVGDSGLTYLGFSYGSYLGATYANLYPDRVRALVVDGVLDPRLWSAGRQVSSDRTATREVLDEFLRLCDEAGKGCAFRDPEGTARRWDRLVEAVRSAPAELAPDQAYTYDLLISDVTAAMYVPETWGGDEGLAVLLDELAELVLDGREETVPAFLRTRAALVDRWNPAAGGDDDPAAAYPNSFDAFYGNHCADARYPRSLRTWVEVDRYARAGSAFGPYWWWQNAGCAHWPVNRDRYSGPWTARTAAPVLVVGNYFDNATDYAGAVALDHLLPSSRLLSYAGWGHTAYDRSPCVADHVRAYLTDGDLPDVDTVCPARPNPFLGDTGPRTTGRIPGVGLPPPWLVRPGLPVADEAAGAAGVTGTAGAQDVPDS